MTKRSTGEKRAPRQPPRTHQKRAVLCARRRFQSFDTRPRGSIRILWEGHSYLHVYTVPIDTLCSFKHNFSSKSKHFGHEWAAPEFTPPRHHATTPPRLAHYLCKSVGPTVSSLLTLGTRQRSIYEVVSGGMAVCSTWKPGFRWGSASFPILAGSRASAGVGLVRPSRPPSVAPHKTRFALSASVYAV